MFTERISPDRTRKFRIGLRSMGSKRMSMSQEGQRGFSEKSREIKLHTFEPEPWESTQLGEEVDLF